jgi:hypothetical protein
LKPTGATLRFTNADERPFRRARDIAAPILGTCINSGCSRSPRSQKNFAMPVSRFPHRKFDATSEWMLANGIPLNLKNWLEINYWHDVKLSELDAEVIAEIPDYLLPKEHR